MSKVKVPKHTEQVLPQVENLLKSWTLISLLIFSFFLTQISIENIDKTWVSNSLYLYLSLFIKGILILVLGTFNAILIMGLGILGHEGTHWTLFKNRFLNDFWGGILWALGTCVKIRCQLGGQNRHIPFGQSFRTLPERLQLF
jgi:hypothetical protein